MTNTLFHLEYGKQSVTNFSFESLLVDYEQTMKERRAFPEAQKYTRDSLTPEFWRQMKLWSAKDALLRAKAKAIGLSTRNGGALDRLLSSYDAEYVERRAKLLKRVAKLQANFNAKRTK